MQRVHLLRSQRRNSRTLCGKEAGPGASSWAKRWYRNWRRCRIENARGEWCETCLRTASPR